MFEEVEGELCGTIPGDKYRTLGKKLISQGLLLGEDAYYDRQDSQLISKYDQLIT